MTGDTSAATAAVTEPRGLLTRVRSASWPIWAVGAGVYVLAVFHRSSLGVAGPQAAERLDLSAAQLSTFVMLQLGVYAAMQVPTGIMVDRFGPRRMLLAATVTMGVAQLLFSQVDTFALALLARGMLGCGDAMTYVSVLRLVAGWFPPRRYPMMVVFSGLAGMLGGVAATVPLTLMLTNLGWGTTFALAGSLSLGYALLLLRRGVYPAPFAPKEATAAPGDALESSAAESSGAKSSDPAGRLPATAPVHRPVLREVKGAWRLPAGRLAFWVHLSTMAGPTAFGALWGYPYLTQGLGYAPAQASSLLLLLVVGSLAANVVIAPLLTRRPAIRGPLAVLVAVGCLTGWLALICWARGQPPVAVVVTVIAMLSVGGPASSVGFMLARDYNPHHRISTATGLVNVGGFCGAVLMVFGVGQILDRLEPGAGVHSLAAFRWALLAIAAITAFGIVRMVVWLLRTRVLVLRADARGEHVPVHLVAHRWDRTGDLEALREHSIAGNPAAGNPADGNLAGGNSAGGNSAGGNSAGGKFAESDDRIIASSAGATRVADRA